MAAYDFLLFDLDGTLSDPLLGVGRSINHALARFGHPEVPLEQMSACIGPPLEQSFRRLTGVQDEAHILALIGAYRERYGAIGYAENTLYPGVPEALQALSAAGMPMALCTSKRADFAAKVLDLFGLRPHFRFISGGDVGREKWQQIAELKAEDRIAAATLMIGDRAVDISAARRNGLDGAGVLWGHGSREELEAAQPRQLFQQPDELPSLAPRAME